VSVGDIVCVDVGDTEIVGVMDRNGDGEGVLDGMIVAELVVEGDSDEKIVIDGVLECVADGSSVSVFVGRGVIEGDGDGVFVCWGEVDDVVSFCSIEAARRGSALPKVIRLTIKQTPTLYRIAIEYFER